MVYPCWTWDDSFTDTSTVTVRWRDETETSSLTVANYRTWAWTNVSVTATGTNLSDWTIWGSNDFRVATRGSDNVICFDVDVDVPPRVTILERRAERLLRHLLPAKQRRLWERFRYITVPSRVTPGVVYRIPDQGMIRVYKHGKPLHDLCVHPAEQLPIGDKVALFKLMLDTDEQELLRVAIVHPIREMLVSGVRAARDENPAYNPADSQVFVNVGG